MYKVATATLFGAIPDCGLFNSLTTLAESLRLIDDFNVKVTLDGALSVTAKEGHYFRFENYKPEHDFIGDIGFEFS